MSGFQTIPEDAIGWPVVWNCQDSLPCIMFKKLLMSLAFFSTVEAGFSQGKDLVVMTFNIRLNTPSDGQNAWPLRKDKAASQIYSNCCLAISMLEWEGMMGKPRESIQLYFMMKPDWKHYRLVHSGYRRLLMYQEVKVGMPQSQE